MPTVPIDDAPSVQPANYPNIRLDASVVSPRLAAYEGRSTEELGEGLQRLGDARRRLQRLQHPFQSLRREIMPRQTDRAIVGKAQTLQHDHPAATAYTQSGGNTLIRGNLPQLPDYTRRLFVMFPYPLRKARSGLDVIIQHVLGDERTSPLLYSHQSIAGQFLQRPPYCMPVDAELRGQLRFGR